MIGKVRSLVQAFRPQPLLNSSDFEVVIETPFIDGGQVFEVLILFNRSLWVFKQSGLAYDSPIFSTVTNTDPDGTGQQIAGIPFLRFRCDTSYNRTDSWSFLLLKDNAADDNNIVAVFSYIDGQKL